MNVDMTGESKTGIKGGESEYRGEVETERETIVLMQDHFFFFCFTF